MLLSATLRLTASRRRLRAFCTRVTSEVGFRTHRGITRLSNGGLEIEGDGVRFGFLFFAVRKNQKTKFDPRLAKDPFTKLPQVGFSHVSSMTRSVFANPLPTTRTSRKQLNVLRRENELRTVDFAVQQRVVQLAGVPGAKLIAVMGAARVPRDTARLDGPPTPLRVSQVGDETVASAEPCCLLFVRTCTVDRMTVATQGQLTVVQQPP